MLTLTRKVGASVKVLTTTGDIVEFVVHEIRRNQARVGVKAPRRFPIYREEVFLEAVKNVDVIDVEALESRLGRLVDRVLEDELLSGRELQELLDVDDDAIRSIRNRGKR